MKVLEVTTLFPRWSNDSRGPIVYETTKALKKLGVDITVINQHGPGCKTWEELEGIKVYRPRYFWPDKLEVLHDIGGGLPAAWEKKKWTRVLFPFLLMAQAIAVLRLAPYYDLVHTQFTISAAAAVLGEHFHQKPIVATVRGSDIYRIPKYPGGKEFTRLALSKCNKITLMSKDLLNTTVKLGISSDKFESIPPPIDFETFYPNKWEEREPYVVFIGSLIKRKGPDVLIEAFKKVSLLFPDYTLIIVGTGPEEQNLLEQVQRLGLEGRLKFISHLVPFEIANLLRRSRLLVLPSLEEALGMVIVESLASGTPVVATNVGGIPEVLPSQAGILVSPNDPYELSDAICYLLGHPAELELMSKFGESWARSNFISHQQNALRLKSLFENVLQNG